MTEQQHLGIRCVCEIGLLTSLFCAIVDQQVALTCPVSGDCTYSYDLSADNQVISHTNPGKVAYFRFCV